MSTAEEDFTDIFLKHYGVKGMKWGVRRDSHPASAGTVGARAAAKVVETRDKIKRDLAERTSTEVTVRTKPGQMVRVVGGNRQLPHDDAIKARTAEQIAKKNTLDALSNQDLQHLVNRMNLEQQYRNLAVKETRGSAAERMVTKLIAEHSDDVVSSLGPKAKYGKQAVDLIVKKATENKGLSGGSAGGDKKNKNKDK